MLLFASIITMTHHHTHPKKPLIKKIKSKKKWRKNLINLNYEKLEMKSLKECSGSSTLIMKKRNKILY